MRTARTCCASRRCSTSPDGAGPVVLDGIHHLIHPPIHLAAWPAGSRQSRIVIIAQGLPMHRIESLAARLSGEGMRQIANLTVAAREQALADAARPPRRSCQSISFLDRNGLWVWNLLTERRQPRRAPGGSRSVDIVSDPKQEAGMTWNFLRPKSHALALAVGSALAAFAVARARPRAEGRAVHRRLVGADRPARPYRHSPSRWASRPRSTRSTRTAACSARSCASSPMTTRASRRARSTTRGASASATTASS